MAIILTNTDNVTNTDDPALQLNDAFSVTTVVVGGTTYLFAAGAADDGVSVFAVGVDAEEAGSFDNLWHSPQMDAAHLT